jgi:outer membrane protein TolC
MAQLIEQGLAHDAALACQATALAQRNGKARARTVKARLARLVTPRDDAATRLSDAYALAQARSHLAANIALAYVEARRWQQRITLRAEALGPLRDNAEIARFRREAGLVAVLDGDMADVMTGLETANVDAARGHLGEAITRLSQLTGAMPDDLRVLLGPDGALPTLVATAGDQDLSHRADLLSLETRLTADLAHHKVSQGTIDAALKNPADASPASDAIARWIKAQTRASAEWHEAADALTTANTRIAPLDHTQALATRAAGDARLAYRSGTDSFATLYVAEAAALATSERRVDTQAAIAGAAIALWSAQGRGWQASDLTPSAPSSGGACGQP